MSSLIDRANLLIQQSRPEEAVKYAQEAIAEDPESYGGFMALAYALGDLEQGPKAIEAAQQLIALEPDAAESHYTMGYVLYSNSDYQKAELSFQEAHRLDSEDPNTLGFLAHLRGRTANWSEALKFADEGLRIESENTICISARSNALLKLKRNDEAKTTVDYALNQDPENAYIHIQKGQYHLESGQYQESAESFAEALRLDPSIDSAKEGLVQALKARYKIYALFLNYTFFMGRLSSNAQWGIMIGGFIAYKIVKNFAEANGQPGLSYLVTGLWLGTVLFTWTADSLFNLLLLLNPLGRHALSVKEKRISIILGLCLALTLITLCLCLVLQTTLFLLNALAFAFVMIPCSSLSRLEKTWKLWLIGSFSGTLLILNSISVFLNPSQLSDTLSFAVLISAGLYSWVSSALSDQ